MIHCIKSLQKINLAFRLALLTCLIDFSYFDRGLSLALDRLVVALEGGPHD